MPVATTRPKGGRPPGAPRNPTLNKARTHLRLDARRAADQAMRYRAAAKANETNGGDLDRRATLEQLALAYQHVADYLQDFLEKRFM